jgi:sortase A
MATYSLYGSPNANIRKLKRLARVTLVAVLFGAGIYILLLTQAPNINFLPRPSVSAESIQSADGFNKVVIAKIGVDIPYFEGSQSALNQGAWHRFPERGNPKDGGNFILSAHRFQLGLTPWGTKAKSPFYNLQKLEEGDDITVVHEGKTYNYKVTKKYDVERTATEIEAPSQEAKLTLYSCALGGEKAGRLVIEAKLQ